MYKTNKELDLAKQCITSTSANIFLTGKAGTGKTTFLHEVVKKVNKNLVVAAPTGVAAINAGGVTLHSLFLLPFSPYIIDDEMFEQKRSTFQKINKKKQNLIRSIELLVIDEISMVRADTLDAVDDVLRRVRRNSNPFGGVQIMLIGDVEQLAPVCKEEDWEMLRPHYQSPFFFDSKVFQKCSFVKIELQEIFRQKDATFTEILNGIRENKITENIVNQLNTRYIPDFKPKEKEGYVTLTTHVQKAKNINLEKLAALKSKSYFYEAVVKNEFPENLYPNDAELELKVGAQVIFIKNGHTGDDRYFYNGMTGRITNLHQDTIEVQPADGSDPLEVSPIDWKNVSYSLNKDTGEVEEEVKGIFTQFPVKCAWAITIHKSQGLTFDKVIIDTCRAFAHGQTYVGFSRCKTLEGLVLTTPFSSSSIIKDNHVNDFSADVKNSGVTDEGIESLKKDYYLQLLESVFGFSELSHIVNKLTYWVTRKLSSEYDKIGDALTEIDKGLSDHEATAKKFRKELQTILSKIENYESDDYLKERIEKGSNYFKVLIIKLQDLLPQFKYLAADSQEVQKKIEVFMNDITEATYLKSALLALCSDRNFSIDEYRTLKLKSLCGELARQAKSEEKETKKVNTEGSEEIANVELYDMLREWRRGEAARAEKPLFVIASNNSLLQIAAQLPRSKQELQQISGIGKVKIKMYGQAILELVDEYLA